MTAGGAREGGFLAALIDAGLLVPTSVVGLYGRSSTFERILTGFDDLVTRETSTDDAETIRFPPVLPREQLETAGYIASFPHLAGSVFSFDGTEEEARELGARARRHDDWSDLQSITDTVLAPAACYPVYPWVASAGELPAGGRLVDICSYCFRHEGSEDPARMRSFRMRELVRIGGPGEVAEWHRDWVERGGAILASVGLETEVMPASDPFFGRVGRKLATTQREQGLKLERLHPTNAEHRTAIMSVNYHVDHFGLDFDIRLPGGTIAHSACAAFGLERVTLALLRTHGLEPAGWPEDARRALGLA